MAAPASSTSQLKASSHLTVPSLVLRALGTVYCTGVFVLLNVWVVPSIVNCLTSGGGPSKLTAFIQSHDLYLKSRLLDVSRILEGVPHPFAGLFVGLVCRVLFDNVLRSRSSFSSEPSLVRLWDQRSSMLRFLANPMKPINHFYASFDLTCVFATIATVALATSWQVLPMLKDPPMGLLPSLQKVYADGSCEIPPAQTATRFMYAWSCIGGSFVTNPLSSSRILLLCHVAHEFLAAMVHCMALLIDMRTHQPGSNGIKIILIQLNQRLRFEPWGSAMGALDGTLFASILYGRPDLFLIHLPIHVLAAYLTTKWMLPQVGH